MTDADLIREARRRRRFPSPDLVDSLVDALETANSQINQERTVLRAALDELQGRFNAAESKCDWGWEKARRYEALIERAWEAEKTTTVRCGQLLSELQDTYKRLARAEASMTPLADFVAELAADDERCGPIKDPIAEAREQENNHESK